MVTETLKLIENNIEHPVAEITSLLYKPVSFLADNGVPVTEEGFMRNLKEWASSKGKLALELSKHPKWDENKWAIVTEMDVHEAQDISQARDHLSNIIHRHPSMEYLAVHCLLRVSADMTSATISKEMAEKINQYDITNDKGGLLRTKAGARIGRVVRQILEYGGATLQKEDEIDISNLSSAIREVKQTVPLHISIHPIDYMLMSMGTNWSTCQTLNANLADNMSRGDWRRGVFSYMNDCTTVVAFIPSENSDGPYPKKRCRSLFHVSLDNQAILQGRLYPYGADSPIHDAMRLVVTKEIASVQGWNIKKAVKVMGHMGFFQNDPSHYPDYIYEMTGKNQPIGANVTTFNGSKFPTLTPIGNSTYCTRCGHIMGRLPSDMLLCTACHSEYYGHQGRDDDDDYDDYDDE